MKRSYNTCDVCGKEEFDSTNVFKDWFHLSFPEVRHEDSWNTIRKTYDICSIECLITWRIKHTEEQSLVKAQKEAVYRYEV
jgi:hypothetical protein